MKNPQQGGLYVNGKRKEFTKEPEENHNKEQPTVVDTKQQIKQPDEGKS